MEKLQDEHPFFEALLHAIATQFGSHCEVVLHDLTGSYDRTVVMIENGHVTGRKLGDCGSNLGLEVLRGTDKKGDRFGYVTHTPDGKILRSSTIYLRNATGKVIGSLCINLDISNLMMADNLLKEFFNTGDVVSSASRTASDNGSGEIFANDVNQLLDMLIKNAVSEVGKPVSMMSRADKIQAIAYLDAHGGFLISKAGAKVCKYFNISKYTLYSYLDEVHGVQGVPEGSRKSKKRSAATAGKPAKKAAKKR